MHRQFGHPTSFRLITLIRKAGIEDRELEKEINSVSESCDVCCRFKKPVHRPVVCMPMAQKFNEVVSMDLKVRKKCYFLVMVDMATRFCAATVIHNKLSSTVINALFKSWITIFGPPLKFLSDNGLEFNNSELRELGEAFNVKIMATAAESAWSNGTCERLNGVIADIVDKIVAECHCDEEIALSWAVSARNALDNNCGFSPNQLVFGFNPNFPSVFVNNLPALEPIENSEIIRRNLNASHLARQSFIKCESSERLRRALRHNIRETSMLEIQNGDEVYYKRKDSSQWHGVVIGRDGKQVIVRHGGIFYRVHACHLTKVPCTNNNNVTDTKGCNREMQNESEIDKSLKADVRGKEISTIISDNEDENEEAVGIIDDNPEEITGSLKKNLDAVTTSSEKKDDSSIVYDKVRVGQRIQGIHAETGELVSGKIISRAGKSTGKYKNCFNLQKDSDGSVDWVDMDNYFYEWKVVSDNEEMVVFFNSNEVMAAKDKEINNWNDNKVYSEVDDNGQDAI